MEDIYARIVQLFETDRFSVLATLINVTGSAPRGVGTKCLIMEDGSLVGTIGGGLMEAQILGAAEHVFKTRSPMRLRFLLNGADVAETDMLCGGDVDAFLEPVPPENLNHLYIFKRAMEIQRRGGSGILATIVDDGPWHPGQIGKLPKVTGPWMVDVARAGGAESLVVVSDPNAEGFYERLGFTPLEENDLWGEVNPCLILVKHLVCG